MSHKLDTHLGGRQRFVLYTPGFRTCRSADSHTNIPLLIRLVQKKKRRRRRRRNLENDSKLMQTLTAAAPTGLPLVEQLQFRHLLVPVAPADLHMPFQSCEPKATFTQLVRTT